MCQSVSEQQWMNEIKEQFKDKFKEADVLDVGSANLNGTYKPFFSQAGASQYTGIDVMPFNNVDVVSPVHLYNPRKKFNIVFSASQLEHDLHWKKSLMAFIKLCKKGGLIIFSCWNNLDRHGVSGMQPETSLSSGLGNKWSNYYKNRSVEDIRRVWSNKLLKKTFSEYFLGLNPHDDGNVVFWGVKK